MTYRVGDVITDPDVPEPPEGTCLLWVWSGEPNVEPRGGVGVIGDGGFFTAGNELPEPWERFREVRPMTVLWMPGSDR